MLVLRLASFTPEFAGLSLGKGGVYRHIAMTGPLNFAGAQPRRPLLLAGIAGVRPGLPPSRRSAMCSTGQLDQSSTWAPACP
jgi:hypothetical protein